MQEIHGSMENLTSKLDFILKESSRNSGIKNINGNKDLRR